MEPLLRTRQLCLGHPARPRLDKIDLQLERGDRLALLGVNGAGKSTLMMVLAGMLAPRSGRIEIEGLNLADAGSTLRHRIGFLPQRVAAYPELTVSENLAWAGQLQGLRGPRLHAASGKTLEQVGLQEVARRLAGRLSAGMLQRLGLAQAMLHEPEILVLDEPTASLDPLQTAQIRELIDHLPGDTSADPRHPSAG